MRQQYFPFVVTFSLRLIALGNLLASFEGPDLRAIISRGQHRFVVNNLCPINSITILVAKDNAVDLKCLNPSKSFASPYEKNIRHSYRMKHSLVMVNAERTEYPCKH